jgi:hypothetical protein
MSGEGTVVVLVIRCIFPFFFFLSVIIFLLSRPLCAINAKKRCEQVFICLLYYIVYVCNQTRNAKIQTKNRCEYYCCFIFLDFIFLKTIQL